ncbi:hypothetical protein EVAR_69764_1 [Eumeta japonica]|uniref:Uncharacterized protein n=1 Tax=Eumeta variegata TaxID=151549 RepID=A0A4C1T0J3_EUMVA|nr:hypothetical protein EVAR_69764_1 [Eumeta japonica]
MLESAKVVEFEELSNYSDIIEYCAEDLDDADLSNLIENETVACDENLVPDHTETVHDLPIIPIEEEVSIGTHKMR